MPWYSSHGWTWLDPYTRVDGSGYVKFYSSGNTSNNGEIYIDPPIPANIWDSYSQIKIEFKFCFTEVIPEESEYYFWIQCWTSSTPGEAYSYVDFIVYQQHFGSFRAIEERMAHKIYFFPFEQGVFYTFIIELDKIARTGKARIIEYPLEFLWSFETYPPNRSFFMRFMSFHPAVDIHEISRLDYVKMWGKE